MSAAGLRRTRWRSDQRAKYQKPNGNYCHAALAPVIAAYRENGYTLRDIATVTRIPYTVIHNAARVAPAEPSRGMTRRELADATGASVQAIRQHLIRYGTPYTRHGRRLVVAQRDADQIVAYYHALPRPADVADKQEWWTKAELAAYFGCSVAAMSIRLTRPAYQGIRHMRPLGVIGNAHHYSAADARRVYSRLPLGLSKPPVGTLSSSEVARLLGITTHTAAHYAKQGAPHVRVRHGTMGVTYYRPAELAAWLMGRKHRVPRSLGRTLLERIQQGRAA